MPLTSDSKNYVVLKSILRTSSPTTPSEIVQRTGLSPKEVSNAIQYLEDEVYIEKYGSRGSQTTYKAL